MGQRHERPACAVAALALLLAGCGTEQPEPEAGPRESLSSFATPSPYAEASLAAGQREPEEDYTEPPPAVTSAAERCSGEVTLRPVLLLDSGDIDDVATGECRSTPALALRKGEGVEPGAVPSPAQAMYGQATCKFDVASVNFRSPAAGDWVVVCDDTSVKHLLAPAVATGADVQSATAQPASDGSYRVSLTLDAKGAAALAKLTRDAVQLEAPANRIAIVVGDLVAAAPAVEGVVSDGHLQLTGDLNREEAEQLAAALEAAG